MKKYTKELNRTASILDALLGAAGEITRLANEITESNSDKATVELLKHISDVADSIECSREIKQVASTLKDCLISYYGYNKLIDICNREKEDAEEDNRSLEDLLTELNKLIGLESVKEKVNDLIAYQTIQKLRRDNGLFSSKNTLHLAFTGNPGTGKTTVARIVGHIYKKIGLLSKGHFVEVSRTDLIAGYQGQTALKVKEVVDRARGGVLFIDEAYSITENDHTDSYGRECLTELTKALEDYRDDLVVIVAGYTEPMNKFFESNPGLKSRFNTFIEFGDYSSDELMDILRLICSQNDYFLDEELSEKVREYFDTQIADKGINFANARMVRNLYEDLVMNHAKRIVSVNNPTIDDLSVLLEEDM